MNASSKRRGPLRAVAATVPSKLSPSGIDDVLECGHRVSHDDPARSARRRCWACPESPRAHYFRAYDEQRKLKRGAA